MYKDHFRLRAMPFSIAPDPSYFYLSNQHREALTLLRHALAHGGGVAVLTGEVGAGKTTVCRRLLDELPGHVDVALIHNPRLTAHELLLTACQALGVEAAHEDSPAAELTREVAEHMAASARSGRATLLIIDEAQSLRGEVLDQMRLLHEASGPGETGLRIVLIGQPELNDLLAQPQNARFNELVAMRHHLGPLERSDVDGYVQHRLGVAGSEQRLFPRRLMPRLHRMSQGVPRVINLICDRALLGAYVLGKAVVTGRILAEARAEALGQENRWSRWRHFAPYGLGAAGLVVAGVCFAVVLRTPAAPAAASVLPAEAVDTALTSLDPMDPSDWPFGMGGRSSEALAYAALLKRWDVSAQAELPCNAPIRTGLRCVQGRDDFDDLRRLNTPAVLQLMDRGGRKMHVALVQVRRNEAVLQLGDTVRRVPVSAVVSQWTRQYTLLWRPPQPLGATVGVGSGGPAVDWIRERIARWKGLDAGTLPRTLDGPLKTHLQAFQTLEGLRATGAADLRTLVHLATRTEQGAPVLEPTDCAR
jgi:general secretion pathway protein A